MGNILRCFKGEDSGGDHYPYYKPTSRPHYPPPPPAAPARPQQPLGPHGVTPSTVGVAALAHDLLNFESTSMVPDGLSQHVASSRKAQVKWYKNMLEAYKNTTPPPKTPVDASHLIARALHMIQRSDLEGILEFYNFPIPSLPTSSSNHQPSSLPEGVQFVLNTLPVYDKCIGDGDGFTAYVSTTDPRESANVPLEVHEMVIARTQARQCRDYQSADALLSSLDEAGYKGIDAPELKMPYGKESWNALVKLIGGKSVKIYVYDLDQFGRYVGDIYCNNVFIQEQMLKNGHAWHFKTYDKRPEFARWEREAKSANRGLWASGNPEKPWDWRRDQRNARQEAIQVY
ncbi:probable staphylococcal-like nuclease CAN3 isoform X2 [Oryza brachyantha]|uniref:probable staphylococcal-like nuclease CAN3 isoform X2 n=1 Tax=Oryza brachyantha TaxID=4533 RepID=UPI001AD9C40D|nr:probable staphylococcal-like nuclease CAN3 isoform X2 [Oryza brachyantha]